MKPVWCAKPSPCDFDKGSAYCPHRECRIKLIDHNDKMFNSIMAYTQQQSMENHEGLIRALVPE